MEENINMKHFIVGPVEMYPCTKEIYQKGITYFRTEEFSKITLSCLKRLNSLVGNSLDNSMIYLTASGSAAMEAVVENCTNENEKCLVINGGTFGKRFCDLLKFHSIDYDSLDLPWGEVLTKERLDEYNFKKYTTLFVNLHETSIGQLYDIELISDFCKKNNMFLIVDAISTFLADDYDMQKYNIDVTIISSQKGLCLSPGLSMVSMSKRMIEKVKNTKKVASSYFDFKDYLKNIERGQTPYTPAVCIMYELKAILDYIDSVGGKKQWLNQVEKKAQYFRKKALELGFEIPKYPLSDMLTPLIFKNISAFEVTKILKDRYQIFVNPCGGELADKLLRVSHIGNTNFEDIDNLLEKMSLVVNELEAQEVKI